MNNIPAGYQVNITSWENDADNYNTITINGLSLDGVKFVHSLCKLFTSVNNSNSKGFGNIGEHDEVDWTRLAKEVNAIVSKNMKGEKNVLDNLGWDISFLGCLPTDTFQEKIGELMYEFIGGCEYTYFRVFESMTCYYFPIEVQEVNLEDAQ